MQLDDLRIFVATVETRSFTAAANKLALSKQLVSRRVMALEESLGVRLLVRNTRKLAITDLGSEFYERAKRILSEVSDAEQAMSSKRSEPRGLLRISVPMSFGVVHLSPLIAEFMRANPEVRVDIDFNDRMVDVIGEGFDVALRIGPLADSSLIAQKFADIRMITCCGLTYAKARRLPVVPIDLKQHPCLLYGQEGRTGWEFSVDGKLLAIDVSGPLRSNNGDVIRDAAIAGLGVARLPEFIVSTALKSGRLQEVLTDCAIPPMPLHAVYPQHRQSAVTVRALTQFLQRRLARALA